MNRRTFAAAVALGGVAVEACGAGRSPCRSGAITPAPAPTAGVGGAGQAPVSIRVEPFVPTNLGDRVTGPTTIYIDAPGAQRVAVYAQPLDAPYGGGRVGVPKRIGDAARTRDGFTVRWDANEPHPYVELFAVAYDAGDSCTAHTSLPITILLDWRHNPPPQGA